MWGKLLIGMLFCFFQNSAGGLFFNIYSVRLTLGRSNDWMTRLTKMCSVHVPFALCLGVEVSISIQLWCHWMFGYILVLSRLDKLSGHHPVAPSASEYRKRVKEKRFLFLLKKMAARHPSVRRCQGKISPSKLCGNGTSFIWLVISGKTSVT